MHLLIYPTQLYNPAPSTKKFREATNSEIFSLVFFDKRYKKMFKNNTSSTRITDLQYVLHINENMFFSCIRNGMN